MTWDKLKSLHSDVQSRQISSLMADDRPDDFTSHCDGLSFDYSKTNIDTPTRNALIELAEIAGLSKARAAMFGGEQINETEGRAVLHTVLRDPEGAPVFEEGQDVKPAVRAVLGRMVAFSDAIRSGEVRTSDGLVITDVVNIGIGGSDLGPAMAARALTPYIDGPRLHFVANVDGADIHDTLRGLDPKTTLLIVASKTFTTIETMTNAKAARKWIADAVGTENVGHQMVAVSTSLERTAEFGVTADRVFGFEDWVGGRYSMWGPIGLCLMIGIGPKAFSQFLDGGRAMDAHFVQAEGAKNMPLMLALVGIWHNQICGYATRAVLPYDQRLGRLPAYLQQLEMESNGKRVAMDGTDLARHSGPVVWGEPGTNGQHAFYQLIHQGTRIIPCEFMVAAKGHEPDLENQHALLVANCLAQSQALMLGRDLEQAMEIMAEKGLSGAEQIRQAKHRVFPGNRPSTTLIYQTLTPFVLGQIIALYEHRVFVEGVILGINSFDQWGVELGKELATALGPVVTGGASSEGLDASTASLVRKLAEMAK